MEQGEIILYQPDELLKLEVRLEGDNVWLNRSQLAEAADGKVYQTEHYNLDMVISVGFRVKSKRGVEFRWWLCAA